MRRAFLLLMTTTAILLMVSGVALAQTTPQGTPDAACPSASGMGFFPFWGGTKAAQTFTAQNNGKLTSAQALIAKNGGSQDVIMEIASVDASGTPSSVLASTTIPNSVIDTTNHLTTITGNFDPSSAAFMVAGRKYALILRTADTVQTVWFFRDGNPCPGNLYGDFGGGWNGSAFTGQSNWDTVFSIFVSPSPPPNDDFSDAQVISGNTALIDGSNSLATQESGDPSSFVESPSAPGRVSSAGRSVWYRWKAPASGPTTIDTCNTDYDSMLGVYTGSALNSLTEVTSNNNDCPSSWGSKVTFEAMAGTTYYIDVDGCCGAPQGAFTLKLVAPADTTAPTVSMTPPEGKTGVRRNTDVKATFSEPMDLQTLVTDPDPSNPNEGTSTTFTLVKASDPTTPVPAMVSYDPTTNTVTLNPFGSSTQKLSRKKVYTAKISGAKDLAGNPLPDVVWSFKTGRR